MKKLLTCISVLGLMLGLLVMPVKADGNFAIGVIANLSTFDTSGHEQERQNSAGSSDLEKTTATHSEDVEFGSLFVEYQAMTDKFLGITFGLEYVPGEATLGAKSRTDTQSDTEETDDSSGTYTAKAQVSNHMAVYIEPTIGNEWFGVYAKGGLSRVTVETLESIANGTDSSAYGDEGVFGWMAGVGMKAKHSSGLFLKLEGLTIDYDKVTLLGSGGNANYIEAEPEQDSVRLAIGFAF